MSTPVKATVAVVAVALAVVLFVVLSDDEDEGPAAPAAPAASEPVRGDGVGKPGDGGDERKPEKPAELEVPTILVKGGEPVGGVAELEFTKGERIRFKVRSDVADHVHLHGYDVFEDVPAGGTVSFDVPATIEGVFEVELEDRVVPLAEITVNPG